MNAQHTPGTWRVRNDGPSFVIVQEDGLIIAGTYGFGAEDRQGQEEANARLLAKAPELADALETAIELLEDARLVMDRDREENLDEWLPDIKAALAEAKGETT